MEDFLAACKVAANTTALLFWAYGALETEPRVVELSTETYEVFIIGLEPNLIVPIDARVVHPLSRLEIDHCTGEVVTHKAIGQSYWQRLFTELCAEC